MERMMERIGKNRRESPREMPRITRMEGIAARTRRMNKAVARMASKTRERQKNRRNTDGITRTTEELLSKEWHHKNKHQRNRKNQPRIIKFKSIKESHEQSIEHQESQEESDEESKESQES